MTALCVNITQSASPSDSLMVSSVGKYALSTQAVRVHSFDHGHVQLCVCRTDAADTQLYV